MAHMKGNMAHMKGNMALKGSMALTKGNMALDETLLTPMPRFCTLERDVAQWLECGALPMSLPAVRFRNQLGAGYSEKYHVSPLTMFVIILIDKCSDLNKK